MNESIRPKVTTTKNELSHLKVSNIWNEPSARCVPRLSVNHQDREYQDLRMNQGENMLNKTGMTKLLSEQMDYVINNNLTFQQREELVLKWLVEGLTTEEIANILHVQPEMIELITEFAIENYKPAWAN